MQILRPHKGIVVIWTMCHIFTINWHIAINVLGYRKVLIKNLQVDVFAHCCLNIGHKIAANVEFLLFVIISSNNSFSISINTKLYCAILIGCAWIVCTTNFNFSIDVGFYDHVSLYSDLIHTSSQVKIGNVIVVIIQRHWSVVWQWIVVKWMEASNKLICGVSFELAEICCIEHCCAVSIIWNYDLWIRYRDCNSW